MSMLQDFPAETGVVRVKKEPPKLEGFYSEKARALDKLLALDKALVAKQAAAQKTLASKKTHALQRAVDALRRSQLKINGVRSQLAAPVLTVLAAIALAIVAIASWRAASATASSQPARESAPLVYESSDVVLPPAQGTDIILLSQVVGSQIPVRPEVGIPAISPLPLRGAPVSAVAKPNESQPARENSIGNPPINEAQPVSTSLQARLGSPVDEPAPVQTAQATHVSTLAAEPATVRQPIDLPSERLEAAPIVPVLRPADPTPAIRDVIRRYEAAYERLDASAAKKIWPSLDERALARAFAGLASQTLTLEPCNIDVAGSSAVASCHGFATYVGRVGNKMGQVQRRDWTFELRKSTDDWQIRSVRSN
jgi:hypothetical protein